MVQKIRFLRCCAVALCCFAVAVPQPVLAGAVSGARAADAASSPSGAMVIRDVALDAGGRLVGQVVSTEGTPEVDTVVAILQQDRQVAVTKADAAGQFEVTGLRGGTYTVVAADGTAVFRLWAPGTAPPAASAAALVVIGNRLVRGQCQASGSCSPCAPCGQCNSCCRPRRGALLGRLLRNPWVIAGVVGAAIAIPIATADDDHGPAS